MNGPHLIHMELASELLQVHLLCTDLIEGYTRLDHAWELRI